MRIKLVSKKYLIFTIISLFLVSVLLACSSDLSLSEKQQKINDLLEEKAAAEDLEDSEESLDVDETQDTENTISELVPNGKHYTQFSLNVHDWVFPEDSIDAVTRTIQIHEEYQIPVDIFLNDQTFQIYMDQAPELIELLKTSGYVTINYHLRPPHPAYSGFDILGLTSMTDQELYDTLLGYEEHKLDLETGAYIEDEEGGYQYIKDTLGYGPIALGFSVSGKVNKVMAQIYKEKGAKLYVVHGREINFGDSEYGLFLRPEHVEIKWYEEVLRFIKDGETPKDVIDMYIETNGYAEIGEGLFINIKMHENNYYTQGTSFAPAYWEDYEHKAAPYDPPYLVELAEELVEFRDQDYTDGMWEWYEAAVKYVAENPVLYEPISNKDIIEWLGEELEYS